MPAVTTGTALLIGGGLAAAGTIGSSLIQAESARDAAREQRRAVEKAQSAQETGIEQGQQFQQPFLETGGQAFQTLADLAQQGIQQPQQALQAPELPQFQPLTVQELLNDPTIQAGQDIAMRGVERRASAQGRALSGGTLRELLRESQGLAGQQIGQAFGRRATEQQLGLQRAGQQFGQQLAGRQQLQGERNQALNRLAGIAQTGIQSATNLGNLAVGKGSTLADLALQQGNIGAAEQAARGQAFGGAVQGVGNAVNQQLLLQSLLQQQKGGV